MTNPLLPDISSCTIAVVGLGYVGLPLAVEFAKSSKCCASSISLDRTVIGFDVNSIRIRELNTRYDRTGEMSSSELEDLPKLEFTDNIEDVETADVFIVAVPTPIDSSNCPDLRPLKNASISVGRALKKRSARGSTITPVIIYESTVFPGATEEVCVPILEHESGLKYNSVDSGQGFVCGYSPERINPGDTQHTLTSITKVTSGSNAETAKWVDRLYASIITAGTHLAPSILVAEAAKVIENTQRDLNIALVNELAIIFSHIGIDTLDVLQAAGSKWNFLLFQPGLVGGHCIGVDPYYLTYKSEQLGYYPHLVLAGRRINDGMARWIVDQVVLKMARSGMVIANSKALVLGFSFKEDCSDSRNTKVIDLIQALIEFGMIPTVVDPYVDAVECLSEYNQEVLASIPKNSKYSVVILAVAHKPFSKMPETQWREMLDKEGLIYDLKGVVPRSLNPIRV